MAGPFGPVVDGLFTHPPPKDRIVLPDTPKVLRERGDFLKMEIVTGVTKDEGAYFVGKRVLFYSGRGSACGGQLWSIGFHCNLQHDTTLAGLETATWSVKWNRSLATVSNWYIKTIASFSTPLT